MPIETKEIPANEFRGDVLKKKYTVHYDPSTGVYSFDYVEIPEKLVQELLKIIPKRVTGKDPGEVKAQLDTVLAKEATPPPRVPEKGEITKAAEAVVAKAEGPASVIASLKAVEEERELSGEEKEIKETAEIERKYQFFEQKWNTAKQLLNKFQEYFEEKDIRLEDVLQVLRKYGEGLALDKDETSVYTKFNEIIQEYYSDFEDHYVTHIFLKSESLIDAYKPLEKLSEEEKQKAFNIHKQIKVLAFQNDISLSDLHNHLESGAELNEQEEVVNAKIEELLPTPEAKQLFWNIDFIFNEGTDSLESGKLPEEKGKYDDARRIVSQFESLSEEEQKALSAEKKLELYRAKETILAYEYIPKLDEYGNQVYDDDGNPIIYKIKEGQRANQQKALIEKSKKEKAYKEAKAALVPLQALQAKVAALSEADRAKPNAPKFTPADAEKLAKYKATIAEYERAEKVIPGTTPQQQEYYKAVVFLRDIEGKTDDQLTEEQRRQKATGEDIRIKERFENYFNAIEILEKPEDQLNAEEQAAKDRGIYQRIIDDFEGDGGDVNKATRDEKPKNLIKRLNIQTANSFFNQKNAPALSLFPTNVEKANTTPGENREERFRMAIRKLIGYVKTAPANNAQREDKEKEEKVVVEFIKNPTTPGRADQIAKELSFDLTALKEKAAGNSGSKPKAANSSAAAASGAKGGKRRTKKNKSKKNPSRKHKK